MKIVIILFCVSLAFVMNAQTPMNHGRPLDKIFIGIENEIDLSFYPNPNELTIDVEGLSINGKAPRFIVTSSKVHDGEVVIKRNGIEIERYPYHSDHVKDYLAVAITQKFGIIKGGTYPESVISDIIGLKVLSNVFWLECPIKNFTLTVLSKEIYSSNVIGFMLNNEQQAALKQLESGDKLFLEQLNIRYPGDDGFTDALTISFTVK